MHFSVCERGRVWSHALEECVDVTEDDSSAQRSVKNTFDCRRGQAWSISLQRCVDYDDPDTIPGFCDDPVFCLYPISDLIFGDDYDDSSSSSTTPRYLPTFSTDVENKNLSRPRLSDSTPSTTTTPCDYDPVFCLYQFDCPNGETSYELPLSESLGKNGLVCNI